MAILLGIDVESSGLESKVDRIIELGAVTWDSDTNMPMQILSELIDPAMDMTPSSDRFQLPEEITAITGITSEALSNYGVYERDVLLRLDEMIHHADYYVAHNANLFDRLFVQEAYNRHSMILVEKPWIDTITDIRFPDAIKTRNLKHLAAEHNFLPGFSHRAVFDVLTMLKILSQYDLDAVIARAAEPTLFVQALVTFDQKEMAKELGFHWFAPDKIWWRSMKSSDFEAMKPTCGFQTRLLAGPLE